jgi:hypothetical protein
MDDTLRKVMVLILERLHQIEKGRQADPNLLVSTARTLRSLSPPVDERFRAELQSAEEQQAADPRSDLTDLYARLIALLKDPGPSEEEKQTEFRRILEAFEGPPQ